MNTLHVLLMLIASSLAQAKSLGVIGEVFPVAEKSFLTLIEERLQQLMVDGSFETIKEQWVKTAAMHTNRPAPLNLPRTREKKTHYFRPEIILSNDIKDNAGKVLYHKGTKLNALEVLPAYRPCWLFFNADDAAQMLWAKKTMNKCAGSKLILTGGAIKDAEEQLNTVIYFDQAGRISRKLKIASVPAMVRRTAENQLKIEELPAKENGDVL